MEKELITELSNYCLQCVKQPCQSGCPLNNNIRDSIKLIKEEKYKEAYELLCETTVLQSICGRICPHENQCRGKCIRGIKGEPVEIGKLEAFIGDLALKNNWDIPKKENKIKNKKVAIIGSGPSGLTCSAFLAKMGYNVTIYEKKDKLGGILAYGIPEFRLNNEILNKTINKILDLGISYKTNIEIGKDISIKELEEEYDAIFIGIGANISSRMNIEGENLKGVYGGNELLENKKFPDFKNKNVAVIGGGNVAMDASRVIARLGAKSVKVIYRRAEAQMPATKHEIESAKKDGVEFLFQNNIVKVLGKEKVEKIECIKTELKKKEGDTRLSPQNIEGSNYTIDMDYVIMAIGSHSNKEILDKLGIEINNGVIKINEKNQTSNKKIFAGGDIAGEIKTIAFAARSGRNSADAINEFLS